MKYIEWAFLFLLSGLGIGLANLVGFHVGFAESLPGILILLAIAIAGVAVSKVVPLKLPIVAYVSIIGRAYAGISISDQVKTFAKQGWKMILIGIFVMTGTFLFSALISNMVLSLTGAI